MLNIYKY